jgi:hypothetical protein
MPGVSKPTSAVGDNGVKRYATRPNNEQYFPIEQYTATINSATVSRKEMGCVGCRYSSHHALTELFGLNADAL